MTDATSHSQLPLPEFDHLPIGHLPARIAPLDASQVQALIDYERAHAHRLPVVAVLQHRIEALASGQRPSGTIATDFPEVSDAPDPATVTPETTDAPKINPPSHGDPSNPAR